MSQKSEATTQDGLPAVEESAPKRHSNAQEMLLGKLKITDGKTVSFCQWTVVGAGDQWVYSAIMPLTNGSNHRIVMDHDTDGNFLREAVSDTREGAQAAVQERIMAFLRKQPRWRVIQ